MRILHLVPQLSRLGGGAAAYVWDLVGATTELGVENHLACVRDPFFDQDVSAHRPASVFGGAPSGNPALGISRELIDYVAEVGARVDVVHAHGIRSGVGLAAVLSELPPMLITPHGGFFPQLRARSRSRKRVVELLWDRRYRQKAAAFHATSSFEASLIAAEHPGTPVVTIPIGLRVEEFEVERGNRWDRRLPSIAGKRRLLFLGIMDRKKGLIPLVRVWSGIRAEFPDWVLLIAGSDLAGHEREVRDEVARLGVESTTHFLGGVYGQEKAALYAESDLFVLPTEWENFGIVVGEALASRLPVITTTGTPWECISEVGCGWWIENTPSHLESALRHAMSISADERRAMGERGRQLVRDRFAWPTIARRMADLYRSLCS